MTYLHTASAYILIYLSYLQHHLKVEVEEVIMQEVGGVQDNGPRKDRGSPTAIINGDGGRMIR